MDRLIREHQKDDLGPVSGMMIRVKKGEEKPAGSRKMTHSEVLEMQMKTIMNWQPHYEMWPFTWGVGVLGSVAAMSGIYINNYCRKKLSLMHLARVGTYAPTVILPVVLATTFHKFLVTDKVLVGDFPCTVCAAIRSGTIQTAAGALYPLILGPLMCITNARKFYTYHVPGMAEKGAMLPFLRRILPRGGILMAIVLANFGIAMAISERETLLFGKYLSPTTSSLEVKQEEEFFQ